MGLLSSIFGRAEREHAASARSAFRVDPATATMRAIMNRLPGTDRMTLMKLTYLVQVVHVGRTGQRMMGDWFKATTMGPYDPYISRVASQTVREKNRGASWPDPHAVLDDTAIAAIDAMCISATGATAAQVDKFVRKEGSAWRALWEPCLSSNLPLSDATRFSVTRNRSDDGPVIDLDHMMLDYRMLQRAGPESINVSDAPVAKAQEESGTGSPSDEAPAA